VVDVGGPEPLARSVTAARTGGTVAIAGVLSGFGVAAIPIAPALQHNLRLTGVTVGSVADQAALTSFVSEHGIKPHVSHTLGWDELPEAMRTMQANEHIGKIAIAVP
jgi:D-arabinose 1-dehydrogenase-like Zn-dependent alcohol dehydrogenase